MPMGMGSIVLGYIRFSGMVHIAVFVAAVIFLLSCDPPRLNLTSHVKLKANINNTNEVINLGDTIKIRLVLPDTLHTEENETIPVTSLQDGYYVADIFKIDTVLKKSNYISVAEYFVSEGSISGGNSPGGKVFGLTKSTKPFVVTLNIVPANKGIYSIVVHSQPDNLRINGNDQPIGSITGFNVVDCHFMLLNPYHPEIVADSVRIKQEGFGYYNFRVN